MRFLDILKTAFLNLKANRLRSFLTILGIGLGIGAVVFLVGLGFGLQRLTISKIVASALTTTIDVSGGSAVLRLNEEAVNRFKNLENVEIVSPIASLPGQVNYNNILTDVVVQGIEENFFQLTKQTFVAGKQIKEEKEVIISTATLKLYQIENPQKILDEKIALDIFIGGEEKAELTKTTKEFEVVGVVENDSPFVYIPLSVVKPSVLEFSQVKVKVTKSELVERAKEKVSELGFQATSVSDIINDITRAFHIIQLILAGFGVIAILIASIGMFNTMTIALLERTRDVGVMKALGAKGRDVKRLFITEAIIISAGGGTVGIILAWLLGLLVNLIINALAKGAGATPLDLFFFPPLFILFVIIFSILIGFITGIWPALRASRLNPLMALRYE